MSEQFRTKDQERAAFAWKAVGDSPKEDFVNLAKGAASLVMENGLMQALAFWQSKSDLAKDRIVGPVCKWLCREKLSDGEDFTRTMDSLQRADGPKYLRATEEALAILRWIRLFADARSKVAKQRASNAGGRGGE